MVPLPSQNTVAVCNQTTLLNLHYIISRLVNPHKVIFAPIQTPNIFNLTESFSFPNYTFKIFLFIFPIICSNFISYIP